MNAESIIFYLLAALVAIFSVLSVTTKRIIRAATYLLFVLLGAAGFYFLLGYTFLGSVQVMVYAGGIVVLYVFAVLLTSGSNDKPKKVPAGKLVASAITALVGLAIMLLVILKNSFITSQLTEPNEKIASIHTIGEHMLSFDKYGYVLPFEAVSVLLLACIVGGLLIARKR